MKIIKENLRKYLQRKIDNHKSKNGLDVSTLMYILDWIREYKPQIHKSKQGGK